MNPNLKQRLAVMYFIMVSLFLTVAVTISKNIEDPQNGWLWFFITIASIAGFVFCPRDLAAGPINVRLVILYVVNLATGMFLSHLFWKITLLNNELVQAFLVKVIISFSIAGAVALTGKDLQQYYITSASLIAISLFFTNIYFIWTLGFGQGMGIIYAAISACVILVAVTIDIQLIIAQFEANKTENVPEPTLQDFTQDAATVYAKAVMFPFRVIKCALKISELKKNQQQQQQPQAKTQ